MFKPSSKVKVTGRSSQSQEENVTSNDDFLVYKENIAQRKFTQVPCHSDHSCAYE